MLDGVRACACLVAAAEVARRRVRKNDDDDGDDDGRMQVEGETSEERREAIARVSNQLK